MKIKPELLSQPVPGEKRRLELVVAGGRIGASIFVRAHDGCDALAVLLPIHGVGVSPGIGAVLSYSIFPLDSVTR